MNSLVLSNRLARVASYLPSGAVFADIGSDHAYLPCYVCLHDQTSKAIAGEINEGPFQSALQQVKLNGLTEQISVRKGNGLAVLHPSEVKQITIAGMGGPLIASILEDGKDKLEETEQLIVQPNIDARAVRRWFHDNGYAVEHEEILEEAGHIYEILAAKRDLPSPYRDDSWERDKQFLFGPKLMLEKGPVFQKKWEDYYRKLERNLLNMKRAKNPDQAKVEEFEREMKMMEEEIQLG